MARSAAVMRVASSRLVALAALLLLATALRAYPFWPVAASLIALGYLLVLWWRPHAWLPLVAAALPWLDLAPWTGRFYLDELDLMLLATVAAGYWRLLPQPAEARLSRGGSGLLALWLLVALQAAVRATLPLPATDLNSYADYTSTLNGLRELKGPLWGLLLWPLLCRSAAGAGLARRLVPGMLLGLLMTCLAVIWERWRFPGLMNFSSDYRPTAPFSAMHTGGAALDAYLAISLPFVAWWLTGNSSNRQWATALLLLMLGLFTGFTTFSRDVWLAYGGAACVIIGLNAGPQLARSALRWKWLLAAAGAIVVSAALLARVFASGGYRALAAALVLLCATWLLGAQHHPRLAGRLRLFACATAVVLLALDTALYLGLRDAMLPGIAKGPYLALQLCAAVGALALLRASRATAAARPAAKAVALGTYPALVLAALLVALHWGGIAALRDAAVNAAWAALLLGLSLRRALPLWSMTRASLSLSTVGAAWLALAIPILASAYMEERLATVSQDYAVRMRHWQEAVAMMAQDPKTRLLGAGLGCYPATYFWHNLGGDMPGSFRYLQDPDGNRYLRLLAPRHAIGYGEMLRHLQMVAVDTGRRYRLAFSVRRHGEGSLLQLALCERWLLYPRNCITPALPPIPDDGDWHNVALMIDSGSLGGMAGLPPTPVQLSLAADSERGAIDIDNLSLRPLAAGRELLRNGDFSAGQDGWFFSSDREHLPWHIKNLYVHTYFEQGWAGLAALALLLGYLTQRLLRRGWRGDQGATVLLAAITGMLLVGCFDSVFDVPRLSLLFVLLAMCACMQPLQRAPLAQL
jgi:hypothetical protein